MQSTRASGARFRQRKLSTKHPLQVVNENEIETFAIDEDPQRHIPHVETGVEKAEETEHHLQAVISASAAASLGAKVNQVYIPTPETKSSSSGIPYDQLYSRRFSEPATYIRFSSTVEDCIGPPYNIDEEDDAFLLNFNAGKKHNDKISEDVFEELMSFFELKSDKTHPFANISNAPILTLEEAESYFDDPEDEHHLSVEARRWTKDVYDHWRSRRGQNGNRTLLSDLKFETGADTDDNDAYVCFRRREVRQARKTRGRDAQVTEKLKKLRRELEDARQLLMTVNQRERLIKERIEAERKVFEQRAELRKVKVQQGIKGEKGEDEELLVNQRVSAELTVAMSDWCANVEKPTPKPRPAKGDGQRPTTLRLPGNRAEAARSAPENDLVQLSDIQEEAAAAVEQGLGRQHVGSDHTTGREFLCVWLSAAYRGGATPNTACFVALRSFKRTASRCGDEGCRPAYTGQRCTRTSTAYHVPLQLSTTRGGI
jgi:enhancer of polycomb-like protein